jgi:hypothetical protein
MPERLLRNCSIGQRVGRGNRDNQALGFNEFDKLNQV